MDLSRAHVLCSSWEAHAIGKIEADFQRSADTHLIKLELPMLDGIDIYLKDESTHPTGSLKHRLARSLFLYALCNGWIKQGTPIIESSSGSTAISEAYFARLLGLPFIAVMPKSTAKKKIEQITFYGGQCHFVDSSSEIYAESARLAAELGGHYMDQFTYAERATDWRDNNNIANSIFQSDGARATHNPALDSDEPRHWRHIGDHRPLHSLSEVGNTTLRGRPAKLRFF